MYCLYCTVVGCRTNTERTIVIEAETLERGHEIGNERISVDSVGSCSDGNVLVGLDSSGEYVEYTVKIRHAKDYGLVMVSRGEIGEVYRLRFRTTNRPHTTSTVVSFEFLGSGFG
jgi:hypothetical protein